MGVVTMYDIGSSDSQEQCVFIEFWGWPAGVDVALVLFLCDSAQLWSRCIELWTEIDSVTGSDSY